MASERAASLAEDFAAANTDAVVFAGTCTDAQWGANVPGEGWTVGVVLHHIAEGHAHGLEWVRSMASGEGVADTAEGIDEDNAAHAARAAAVSRGETIALLEENGRLLQEALRRLSDEELDRHAPFGPAGGQPFPTEALAAVAARHVREHLGHARAAAEANPG
jgi:hypothetical protein